MSARKLACAVLIAHKTLSDATLKSVCSHSNDMFCPTVIRQADFGVTVGQCAVPARELACAVLITHKTLSDAEVSVFP